MRRHGGRILVEALLAQEVEVVTCVPGESFLPVLDGLHDVSDRIRLVVTKHEAGAGNMAEAYGKLTQKAGVCMVTRGPGAMHAAIAVHTAAQDATPMLLLVGQVSSRKRGRAGFQEVDFARVFGSMAKEVLRLETVDRIPETIARAIRVAESGRRGPVVVELPEDVLNEDAEVLPWTRLPAAQPRVGAHDLAEFQERLARAERPLLVIGRGPWSESARQELQSFAVRNGIPVLAAFRCQDYIGTDSPAYAGHLTFSLDPALAGLTAEADLVIAVGGQLGDVDTQGYTLWSDPSTRPDIVHVTTDPIDANHHLPAVQVIVATGTSFVRALEDECVTVSRPTGRLERARQQQIERHTPSEGDVLAGIVCHLADNLGEDAVICNGAGNYAVWVHRFARYPRFGSQLAPASGAMGYGLPAAVMASVLNDSRPVVGIAGDGCFMMSVQELATICEQGLTPILIVVNNGIYGTIRMHQEKTFPGRVSGTDISNPNFVQLAESFGFSAHRVDTVEGFAQAWSQVSGAERPALIEVVTDPDLLAPGVRASSLRRAAKA